MSIFKNAFSALYLYRSGYLETLNTERFLGIVGHSVFFRLKIIFKNTCKESCLLFHKNPKLNLENKIVCIVNSTNNYESLKFLASPNLIFLKPTVLGVNVGNAMTYRFKLKFFYSIIFWLSLPALILNKTNRRDLLLLHKAFGLNVLFSKLLKKQKPKQVIFANDHIPEARSYILACQKLGIKTTYIQHGSVSSYFPPLEFDLALLESQYSLDSYSKSKNINTDVKLIGIPKLDTEILKIRKRDKIKKIGVAINQNDDLIKVEHLIQNLIQNQYEVILRKHPADVREIKSSLKIEDGNTCSVFDFIYQSDFLVASDSSIHVEANSLKCRSVYYQLHNNSKKYDYYGFVKNNYVEEIKSTRELMRILSTFEYANFDFKSYKLAYYNEALINGHYGASSTLAKKYIYESIDS